MSREKFQREILEKIHHINSPLNRRLSWLIYLGSILTVGLLLILPYRGRIALAYGINIFFNRPLVYLNFLVRYIAWPLSKYESVVFYYSIFGSYAFLFRLFARKPVRGWRDSAPAQTKEDFRYKS